MKEDPPIIDADPPNIVLSNNHFRKGLLLSAGVSGVFLAYTGYALALSAMEQHDSASAITNSLWILGIAIITVGSLLYMYRDERRKMTKQASYRIIK